MNKNVANIENHSLHLQEYQNDHFISILQDSPVAIYTCDADGHITFFNNAAAKLWGRVPVIGQDLWCGSWKTFYPDGTPMPLDICPMALTLQLGEFFDGEEITIQRPDQNFRSVLVYPKPLFDSDNVLVGAHNTMVDITDKKKDDTTQALLASIIASSDDAIISKDLTGKILSWNKSATSMFGYQPEEIIGRSVKVLIPKDRQKEETEILKRISKGEQVHHYETERITKHGKSLKISLTISPIKNKDGVVIGASKVARDITEQVSIRKKLKKYTKELEQLNKHKDDFMSLASHELKTPLTSARAYIQLLTKIIESDHKGYELTKRAVMSISRLETLIDNLLDISKIKAGKLYYNMEVVSFNEVIKSCLDNMQPLLDNHRINIQNETNVQLIGDKIRLEQALNNFLTNAIKYSPDADQIDVHVVEEEKNLIVSIRDYGIGIASDKIDHLMERYYRVDDDYMRFPGLGIGLNITTEILKRHQGKILIESEVGRGSTFTFIIPIKN